MAAVEKLTSQDVLEQIALKAERSEVRVAAINRITNQAILGKVAADTENYTIVNAAKIRRDNMGAYFHHCHRAK